MQAEAEARAREAAEETAKEAAAIAAADAEVQRMSMHVAGDAKEAVESDTPPPALLVSGSNPADEDGDVPAEAAAAEGTGEDGVAGVMEAAAAEVPPVEPESYTAADVQARVAEAVKAAAVAPRSTALALMMLCMDSGWDNRAGDVVRSVFHAFPEHDWVAATLPAEAHPPDALAAFDCLAPLPWSPFPAKLYLLHRSAP